MPVDPEISRFSDSGTPVVKANPDGDAARNYNKIADAIVREISKLTYGDKRKPDVFTAPGKEIVFVSENGEEHHIKAADLRRQCRCARCVNELTGEQVLQHQDVSEDTVANEIKPMGNYAVSIFWSDGHSSIYPFDMLAKVLDKPFENTDQASLR